MNAAGLLLRCCEPPGRVSLSPLRFPHGLNQEVRGGLRTEIDDTRLRLSEVVGRGRRHILAVARRRRVEEGLVVSLFSPVVVRH